MPEHESKALVFARMSIESYVSNSHIGFDPDYECH